MIAVVYAVLAASAAGFYTFFSKSAAPYVHQLFGAFMVSFTAAVLGLLLLLPKIKNLQLYTDQKGLIFVILTGVAAFSIDYFSLQAYSRGLPVTVGAPIFIAGGIIAALILGMITGESLTVTKMFGIVLVIIGGIIITTFK